MLLTLAVQGNDSSKSFLDSIILRVYYLRHSNQDVKPDAIINEALSRQLTRIAIIEEKDGESHKRIEEEREEKHKQKFGVMSERSRDKELKSFFRECCLAMSRST